MICCWHRCTHFIIGRDMAGSKSSLTGEDFYGAYEAQETANKYVKFTASMIPIGATGSPSGQLPQMVLGALPVQGTNICGPPGRFEV